MGRPAEFCWAAVWLLLHVNSSRLPMALPSPLIAWTYAGTDHLVRNARFRLSLPATTAPPVEALLTSPERTIASTARLLLALAPAVATRFIPQVRSTLQQSRETIRVPRRGLDLADRLLGGSPMFCLRARPRMPMEEARSPRRCWLSV